MLPTRKNLRSGALPKTEILRECGHTPYGDVFPCACAKANAEKFKICNIIEIEKLKNYLHSMSEVECRQDCLNSII